MSRSRRIRVSITPKQYGQMAKLAEQAELGLSQEAYLLLSAGIRKGWLRWEQLELAMGSSLAAAQDRHRDIENAALRVESVDPDTREGEAAIREALDPDTADRGSPHEPDLPLPYGYEPTDN